MSADQDINIRDGTSQAGRMQPALDPDYVSVDERTIQDLLAFAREYAKELRYFDVKDGRLHDAGVRFYVCGQSMTFGDVDKSELASQAEVALSAMTMLTVLQNNGYALLP